MKVKNHKKYALFNYTQSPSFLGNDYELGDVVINENNEIGVIIQIHDNPNEYRTDMFGNCHSGELKTATKQQIEKIRPEIIKDINIPLTQQ